MKIDEHNYLVDKSKTKKDGVWSWNGYFYAVKNGNFIAYSDSFGNISSVHGAFNYNMGKVERYDIKKELIKYLKQR